MDVKRPRLSLAVPVRPIRPQPLLKVLLPPPQSILQIQPMHPLSSVSAIMDSLANIKAIEAHLEYQLQNEMASIPWKQQEEYVNLSTPRGAILAPAAALYPPFAYPTPGIYGSLRSAPSMYLGMNSAPFPPSKASPTTSPKVLNQKVSTPHSVILRLNKAERRQKQVGGFLCDHPHCGTLVKSRFSLRRHLLAHEGWKPYICKFSNCGKSFGESNTLKRHMRIHTGEKPFRCEVKGCNRAFADSSNWRRHEASHLGDKRFQCPDEKCGQQFEQSVYLTKHLKKYHTLLGVEKWE